MAAIGSTIPEIVYYVHRKCSADWVIERSRIGYHDISYVAAGTGVYLIDEKQYQVRTGDLLYIPPGSVRQAWAVPEDLMEVYAINFHMEGILPFAIVNVIGYDHKLASLFVQLTRVWMEREELYETDAGALALQILCELYRRLCMNKPVNHSDERIEKIKNYINENYNTKLSLTALGKVVGLSPVYLGALFVQKESCSIREYINKVRVLNAYEIMKTEKLSVNDVALDCGYTDAFYFSRVFKKYMGVSPSKV